MAGPSSEGSMMGCWLAVKGLWVGERLEYPRPNGFLAFCEDLSDLPQHLILLERLLHHGIDADF